MTPEYSSSKIVGKDILLITQNYLIKYIIYNIHSSSPLQNIKKKYMMILKISRNKVLNLFRDGYGRKNVVM